MMRDDAVMGDAKIRLDAKRIHSAVAQLAEVPSSSFCD